MARSRRRQLPVSENPSRTDASSNARNDRAWRAVKAFRVMVPQFTGFARALTGNPKVQVVPSKTTMTDGSKIYIMPPIELGDPLRHDTYRCGERDPETLVYVCKACATREMLIRRVFHEMGHIILDSTGKASSYARQITKALVHEWHPVGACTHAPAMLKQIDYAHGYLEVANAFSPYLTFLLRSMDDVRVDSRMYLTRPGLKVPTEISLRQVFRDGIPTHDGSPPTLWRDAPMNAQLVLGLMLLGLDIEIREGYLSDEAREILSDPELATIAQRARYSQQPVNALEVSIELFRVLQDRRILYVEKCVVPPPPPPPEENNDDSTDEGSDDTPSLGNDDPEDEGGTGGSGKPGPSESSDDAPDGGEEDPGDGSSGSPRQDQPESGDGEAEDDGASGAGEDESSDGAGAGGNSEEAPGDADFDDGELSPGDGGGADSSADGDDSATPAGADPGAGDADEPSTEAGAGSDDPESGEDAGEPGAAGGNGGDGDESDRASNPSASGEGERDLGTEPGSPGEEGPGGDDAAAEDGQPMEEGSEQDVEPGPAEQDDADPDSSDESGADDGEGDEPAGGSSPSGDELEEDLPLDQSVWDEQYGDPEMVEAFIELIHKTGDDAEDADEDLLNAIEDEVNTEPQPGQMGTIQQVTDAIEMAIRQEAVFDLNSHTVGGVQIFEYGDERVNWPPKIDLLNRYSRRRPRLYTPDEFAPDQTLVGRAVRDARIVFSENQQSKYQGNLKSGRINRAVLGRRAPVEDPRLFNKRTKPGKRSYEFIMSLDCSGSTNSADRNPRIKRIAFAQAEVLHRLGIPFAIWGHTGGQRWHLVGDERHAPQSMDEYYSAEYELWMLQVKGINEPWNDITKERLANMPPLADNLDGHTLEFLRKQIMRSRATDKFIQYFTDGQMPAANGAEEEIILREELQKCDRAGIKKLAVGINTTSPTAYGFDTVEVEGDEDILKVIASLEEHLIA